MAELWTGTIWPVTITVFQILLIVIPLLLAVAYVTYAERKVIGAMQLRQGPMTVGPFGLLQPLADGLKLFVKETIIPTGANKVVFLMAPMVTFILALIGWAVIPFGAGHGPGRHQCRRAVPVRDQLAGRLRRDHGRLGQQLALRLPGCLAQLGADGQLRDRDRADHPERAGDGRLAQSLRHRAGAGRRCGSSSRTFRCS